MRAGAAVKNLWDSDPRHPGRMCGAGRSEPGSSHSRSGPPGTGGDGRASGANCGDAPFWWVDSGRNSFPSRHFPAHGETRLDDGASLAAAAPAGLAAVTQQAWKRLQELFGEALELDPAARRLLVERLAGEDPQLSAELQSLLAELESDDDSLQSAAVRDLVAEVSCWKPERIGGYRIIRELGRGGSGIVFQASREGEVPGEPVALKVLRLSGWDEARRRRS